jgi:shikimate kinase
MNAIANPSPAKTLVIVGMPGAGKTSVGRRLAARLALPFVDSDAEVEAAAGMTVSQIFERLGEAEFRKGEKRVMARLLERPPLVLATGGGALMDPDTRALVRERAVSVWLRADIEVLLERTSHRNDRPLIKKDSAAQTLRELQELREPIYAMADIVVTSDKRPADETVERVLKALKEFLSRSGKGKAVTGQ